MNRYNQTDKFARVMAFAIIVIAVCVTFLPFLGCAPFFTKGEPREAVVALSMIKSGNWILPLSNGDVIPYKPPFLAWCIALISLITGGVTEYTSRLPSAIALIVMVIAGYRFWSRRLGIRAAMIGAVVTFTCFEVYRAGFACRVDMVLTMFIVTGMYSLYIWAMERNMSRLPWAAILLLSCGTLTKGPVAIILPLLSVWIAVLLCGYRLWKCTWKMAVVALLALIIPALWYVAAWERGGQEFLDLAMEENFGRMTGTMSYDSHVNPWWYNIITLLGGMAPYTLLLVIFVVCLLMPQLRHSVKGGFYRWRTADNARFFMFIAPLVVFLFYCFPSSKRSVYLLPMYPFLAMQIGLLILWCARKAGGVVKSFTGTVCVIAILTFVVFCLFHIPAITTQFTPGMSIGTMQAISGFMAPAAWWKWGLLILSCIVAVIVFVQLFRAGASTATVGLCCMLVTLYMAFGGVYQPAAISYKTDIPMARDLERIQPNGEIYSFIVSDMMRFFTADFYIGDRIAPFSYEMSPATGLILIGDDDVWEFRRLWDGKVALTETVYRWAKKSCDVGQPVTLYRYVIDDAPRRVARQESLPVDAPAPSSPKVKVQPQKPVASPAAVAKPVRADTTKHAVAKAAKDSLPAAATAPKPTTPESPAADPKTPQPETQKEPVKVAADTPATPPTQPENNNQKTDIQQ